MKDEESITIEGKLFEKSPDEFLKRGPVVILPLFLPENKSTLPYELREKIFDALKKKKTLHYSGFAFMPNYGLDRTPRKIRLNDILEGAKLYTYAPFSEHQEPFKPSIQIRAYDSAQGAETSGATIIAKVPSRTQGSRKYKIKFFHIPIADNPQKFLISPMIKTDHVCEDKINELRYATKKDPDFVSEYRLDEHEIAAYFAIMDYYKNLPQHRADAKANIIPLQMNMTGIPTPMLCTMYDRMLHRVLIKETPEGERKTLGEAHLEALLWEGLIKEGYRNSFFFKEHGKKLKDFSWTQYLK